MIDTVDVVVLAAGQSTRFGSDKRLLTLQPVLHNAIAALGDAVNRVLLVLKDSDRQQLDELLSTFRHDHRLHIIWNPHPEWGMGHSLSLCARELQAQCTLVFLADMPAISAHAIQLIMQKAACNTIVAPLFAGQRGHPVCFGKQFYGELMQLQGDTGAKTVLQKFADQTLLLDVADAGTVMDVDTPEDWQAARDQGLV